MIQANELRIGNKIKNFAEKTVTVDVFILKMIDSGAHDKSYNPIPLTEEWLLTFGFEPDNRSGWGGFLSPEIDDKKYRMRIKDNKWNNGFEVEVKYVHQLQNLYFALTSTELKLSL